MKESSAKYLIPELEIELADGSKVTARCGMAALVAYENLTGNSVLTLKIKSASDMVKFLACAIYGDEALQHLSDLSNNLAPAHFSVIANLVSTFFPSSTDDEGDEEEGKDFPPSEAAIE